MSRITNKWSGKFCWLSRIRKLYFRQTNWSLSVWHNCIYFLIVVFRQKAGRDKWPSCLVLTACLIMKPSETWFAFTLTDLGVTLTFLPPFSAFGFWLVFPLVVYLSLRLVCSVEPSLSSGFSCLGGQLPSLWIHSIGSLACVRFMFLWTLCFVCLFLFCFLR